MHDDDPEIFARFTRRFSAIEGDVMDPPRLDRSGRPIPAAGPKRRGVPVALTAAAVLVIALAGTIMFGLGSHGNDLPVPSAPGSVGPSPSTTRLGSIFVPGQAASGDGWRIVAGGVGLRREPITTRTTPATAGIDAITVYSGLFTAAGVQELTSILVLPNNVHGVDSQREAGLLIDTLVGEGPICGQVRFDGIVADTAQATLTVRFTPGGGTEGASGASPVPCPAAPNVVAASILVAVDLDRLPHGPFSVLLERGDGGGTWTTAAHVRASVGDPEPSRLIVGDAPHWPILGVDAGTDAIPTPGPGDQIDSSWAWGHVAWSPNGRTLAAAALAQQVGQGQIHLFDRTGHGIGAVPGFDFAWVDDTHVVTLEGNADGFTYSAWLWTTDASTSQVISDDAGGFLRSPTGALAILRWDRSADTETFRVWDRGALSEERTGVAAAWSADGRHLFVLRDAATASTHSAPSSSDGLILAAGAPPPVWLQVLAYPGLAEERAFPHVLVNGGFGGSVPVEPSGRFAAMTTDANRVAVFDIETGRIDLEQAGWTSADWTTDGRLILAMPDGHTIRLRDPKTRALSAALAPGTRIATTGGATVVVPPTSATALSDYILVELGAVTPDGTLRAWASGSNGIEWATLHLDPHEPAASEPAPIAP